MSERARAIRQAVNLLAFHRDQHHGWRRAAAWLLVCNALTLAVFAGYLALHSTVYITVAATPDGRLVPLTPLDEPIMSDAALRNWTVAAVTEAFTLGHHDWRLRLSSVRESFTDEGYESFLAGLDESLFLDRLRDNLQVASAVAQGAPVVTETRYFQGRPRLGHRVPAAGDLRGRCAQREPGPGCAGAGDAGAALGTPGRHRYRAADRGQVEARAMRPRAGFAALVASLIVAAGSAAAVAEETAPHTGGEVYQGVPLDQGVPPVAGTCGAER